jgi:catechol 2,3-dioxygenase-like lactoylglutathione lyase family enzyme
MDVAAEARQAEDILKMMPGQSAQRTAYEVAEDDDATREVHVVHAAIVEAEELLRQFIAAAGPRAGRDMLSGMTVKRMDNVGIVVGDLAAAVAFFKELGLELEGEAQVEGSTVDRLIGLDGVRCDLAVMRTADGHGRVELMKFREPAADRAEPSPAPPNTLGIRRIMFDVEDIDDVVARLRAQGAELVGELVQYENSYRLCYVRGPEGILVALAEKIG